MSSCKSSCSIQVKVASNASQAFKVMPPWSVASQVAPSKPKLIQLQASIQGNVSLESCKSSDSIQVEVALTTRQAFKVMSLWRVSSKVTPYKSRLLQLQGLHSR
ncbi:hypothetical protein ACH5RR_013372 [Cinchona calisaya]|uniref:Uncharacterized protein n=1 Tax=Cinchona calisaya TaxID=153742 RepID=A0ABD3A385_9GENT